MPETRVLTRTFFAEGQVPDCPDVTVWCDHYSIIHFEFLNRKQTLNADLTQCMHENLRRKHLIRFNRRNVQFLYDNSKPHSARSHKKRYQIQASLFKPILYIYKTLEFISIFFHFVRSARGEKRL